MAPSKLNPHSRTDDFLAKLTPMQKRSLEQLKQWLGKPRVGLEWYRQVGTFVADLRPSTQATYGTGWVDSLAREVDCSPAFIRKAHSLFQNYSPADVKRLHDRLTFDKIGLLLSIPDKKQRLQFQQLAIKEQWSYPRLMREIQRRLVVRRPRAGRPSPKPTNYGLEVGLQQLIRMAEKWTLHHEHI